jgi:hypothetical protein
VESTQKNRTTVKRAKLNKIYAHTISKEYPKVIVDGMVHEFVGIGWVACPGDKPDPTIYPTAVD